MAGISDDAALAAGEAYGGAVNGSQGHGQQAHGNTFTNRKEHVQFPAGRVPVGLAGKNFQFIGGGAHGTDNHYNLKTFTTCLANILGDGFNSLYGCQA